MDDFHAARSRLTPPLPWPTFAPRFSINTVNALIGRFRAFIQPFCGPASKNLAAYGRWHDARNKADRSYLDALRLLLASCPCANTIF